MSMPIEHDFTDVRAVWVGADWSRSFTWLEDDEATPIPLTGWAIEFLIVNATGTTVLALSTATSGVVITSPAAGTFSVSITAAQSTTVGALSCSYELRMTSGSTVIALMVGRINFVESI